MIDFHCHVDLYPDPKHLVAEIEKQEMYVLAVTTTPLAWDGTNALVRGAKRIRVGLGLHPEIVHERHREVEVLCSLLPKVRYVGEIGLDGSSQYREHFELQRRVLTVILSATARAGGRIMSLHSRGATSAVLDLLEQHPNAGVPVLHWFSGTQIELERAIRLGCWFSVGPAMVRGAKGDQLVQRMPRERVLTETDGPFARHRGAPLVPRDVYLATEFLAKVWRCSVSEVEAQLLSNLRQLTAMG